MLITGFTCGTFDLLHAGHILMLKSCKEYCVTLIVGLQIDPSFRSGKNSPIQTLEERQIQLEGCKYVDKIIKYDTEEDLIELLTKLKPDVRFVGKDWLNKKITGNDLDTTILYNERDHNYSTTELRERILKWKK